MKHQDNSVIMPTHDSQEYLIEYDRITDKENGTIGISLKFKRFAFPFASKYYLPCIWLTIMASISFFVPPKIVPGRGGMLVTLILVLNNIFISSKVITFIIPIHFENLLSNVYHSRMKLQNLKHPLL